MLSGPVDVAATLDESGLDEVELLTVQAWRAGMVPRAPLPLHAWNAPGYSEPVHLDLQRDDDGVQPAAEAATERTMIGSIAIGVVMVSADHGSLEMSQAEQTKVMQEVLQATQFLAVAEPRANVSFDYDFRPVTVATDPTAVGHGDAYERLEAPWRDDALAVMGYPGGRAGYRRYARDLQATRGTQSAFVAFFTKYPTHHFAYAVYEKVVMHYANDGWGPDNLNAVFAHETCHIFGAADEYGSCGCNSKHGALKAKNGNCVACPGTRVGCLMDRNELTLCSHSRLQLGWGAPFI